MTTREGVATFLRGFAGDAQVSELARLIERDRSAVSRWLGGKSDILLADLLHFVDVTSTKLFDFLELLTDPAELPSVAGEYERLRRARRAAVEMPWAHAIVHMADLQSYKSLLRHECGWFASRIGISIADESACLEHLVDSGQLVHQDGCYRRAPSMTVDTRQDPEGTRRIAAFWLSEGSRRVLVPDSGRFSFNTFAVNLSDLEEIRRLQGEYFQKIRNLIQQSEPTEAVAVVAMQFIPLAVDDIPLDGRSTKSAL